MEAFLCIHRSAKQVPKKYQIELTTPEKWKIRDYHKHPVDPGWEIGRYCLCHKQIRSAKKRLNFKQEVTFIIDAVRKRKGKHVIRSMFKVSGVEPCRKFKNQNDLLFKNYYFAPKKDSNLIYVQSLPGLKNYKGTQYKKFSEKDGVKIIKKIQKNYQLLKSGNKPSSIDKLDWKKMINKAKEHRRLPPHKCHFCG